MDSAVDEYAITSKLNQILSHNFDIIATPARRVHVLHLLVYAYSEIIILQNFGGADDILIIEENGNTFFVCNQIFHL